MVALPKFHLLYFKDLLNVAFIKFFEEFNSQFVKIGNEYHLGQSVSMSSIEKFFKTAIDSMLNEITASYDVLKSPNYYFIIGACQPKDNYLLAFKTKSFPKKLNSLLNCKTQLKYILKEKDIKIDIVKFNEACCNVFNDYFFDRAKANKPNVVFLTHKNLDCYSLFKMLKCIFGNTNCINMQKVYFDKFNSSIVAINDLIDMNIHCKYKANKDPKFKKMFREIQQYLDLIINKH